MKANTLPTRLSRGAVAFIAFAAMCGAARAQAQDAQGAFTTRLVAGVSAPAGQMKEWYAPGGLVGIQASRSLTPQLTLTGTTYWANAATHRRDGIPDRAVNWTLDFGIEGRSSRFSHRGTRWVLEPFGGVGAGTRSYSLPSSVQGSTTGWGGYGGLGVDVGRTDNRLGLRAELRAYRSSFTDVQQSMPRTTGTDIVAMIGLGVR